MERLLERRVQYFLTSNRRGRQDVRRVLADLLRHGRLVLIGGMLRDVALFGNAGFRSDLDFVIEPYDLAAFERHMVEVGARSNRFGGYALPSRKWQIDVWPIQRTWANTNGHIRVRTISDLRRVTFFRCDAIMYDLMHRRLLTDAGYFDELGRKVLEINLRPNPNPVGNAIRAIRYSLIKGFEWGPDLCHFAAETIDGVGWDRLVSTELQSSGTRYLDSLNVVTFMKGLDRHLKNGDSPLFNPASFRQRTQLELPFHRG